MTTKETNCYCFASRAKFLFKCPNKHFLLSVTSNCQSSTVGKLNSIYELNGKTKHILLTNAQ